jgi:hypothetical protein
MESTRYQPIDGYWVRLEGRHKPPVSPGLVAFAAWAVGFSMGATVVAALLY